MAESRELRRKGEWCLQRNGKLEKERPVGGKKLLQIRVEKYEGYYVLEMEQISQQIMRMDGKGLNGV